MEVETLDQRYDLLKEMIDEAFAFEESVADLEDDNDWAGAMTTAENLAAVEEMICTEEIFLDAFEDMERVHTRDRDDKENFMAIFYLDGLGVFNEAILLPRLKHTLKVLEDWSFRTERGIEFEKNLSEKLNALIKKYDNLYCV